MHNKFVEISDLKDLMQLKQLYSFLFFMSTRVKGMFTY
jgi:hypothetical protein